MVAFCNIEGEIYEKAKRQVVDLTANDLGKEEDDDQKEGNEDEDTSPVEKDPVFYLTATLTLNHFFFRACFRMHRS